MVSNAVFWEYKRLRAHQLATYGNSRLFVEGVDQRQFTGGGAAYGEHALAAFNSARGFVHFRKTLSADVAAHKRRSKAAKAGWKTRKGAH